MYKFDSLKHAHTFGDKPLMGTTTLIGQMFPPPLAWWASGMALEKLGWLNVKKSNENDRIDTATKALRMLESMDDLEYVDFLQECYRNHNEFKKEAGKKGTDVHAEIERYIKFCIDFGGEAGWDKDIITTGNEIFAKWAMENKVKFLASEAHVFSELLWIGGIVDFIYEQDGKVYLGDVKTSKAIYPNHFIQMGLYDCQQGENGFYSPEGEILLNKQDIEGYTVVNLPKAGGIKVKTYRGTQKLREFGVNLVASYKVKSELEKIC